MKTSSVSSDEHYFGGTLVVAFEHTFGEIVGCPVGVSLGAAVGASGRCMQK